VGVLPDEKISKLAIYTFNFWLSGCGDGDVDVHVLK
jgi:hypothetical protein